MYIHQIAGLYYLLDRDTLTIHKGSTYEEVIRKAIACRIAIARTNAKI